MRESLVQLYVHIVWSTWDRLPLIAPELEQAIYACIQSECKALNTEPIAIGGTCDHVHLLARIPASLSVSALVKQVKGSSSHLVTHVLSPLAAFKWQGGYGAFSVSPDRVPVVRSYVVDQKMHHGDGTTDVRWEADFAPEDAE